MAKELLCLRFRRRLQPAALCFHSEMAVITTMRRSPVAYVSPIAPQDALSFIRPVGKKSGLLLNSHACCRGDLGERERVPSSVTQSNQSLPARRSAEIN